MTSHELPVKVAINSWRLVVERADKIFSRHTEDQLLGEVAPEKNRAIYLWGTSDCSSRQNVYDSGPGTPVAPGPGCCIHRQFRQSGGRDDVGKSVGVSGAIALTETLPTLGVVGGSLLVRPQPRYLLLRKLSDRTRLWRRAGTLTWPSAARHFDRS
jgi:hypothetical protein